MSLYIGAGILCDKKLISEDTDKVGFLGRKFLCLIASLPNIWLLGEWSNKITDLILKTKNLH